MADNITPKNVLALNQSIILRLPYPPSVNHYKTPGRLTTTKTGKIYQPRVNSVETTNYFYEVWFLCRQFHGQEGGKFDRSAKISADVALYAPDNRKRDIDNPLKVLLDSLVHAKVIPDDSQIHRLIVHKVGTIPPNGQVIVTLSVME